MKKLMFAFAIVAMAMGVQAASVTWQAVTGDKNYSGWTAYLYNGSSTDIANVLATVIAEDAVPKGWTDSLSVATGSTGLSASVGGRGSTTAAGVADVNNAEAWTVVLMNGGFAEGTKYAVMETYNVSDYSYSGGDTPKTMKFETIKATGTLTVESVPEPTSGLLLLLGVASLALRRRRA